MCCLKFEQSSYESMHKIMPRVGKEVVTPDGTGTVVDNNVISETTVVKVQLDDGTFEMRSYPFRELANKAGKLFGEECEACTCKEEGCPARAGQPSADPYDISEEVYDSAASNEADEVLPDADNTGDGTGGDTL